MAASGKRGRERGRGCALRHLMALAVLVLFLPDTSALSRFDPHGATAPSLPVARSFRLAHLPQPMPGHPPAGTSFLCLPPHSGENS